MAFQVLTAAVFAAQAIGTATSAVLTAAAAAGTAGLAAAASLASIAYTSYATKKAEADARKNAAQAPRDITVRSATEPAKVIYGTARTSGPVVYTNTAPTPGTNDNNTLWTVISLCSHEVEDITDIWLDGDEITASQINWGGTGGVTSGKYGPIGSNQVTNFYKRLGTSTQSHVSELATAFTDWTSSYQGKNVAYIVSAFELGTATGEGVWAQGAPTNIRAVVKGKKVYDPRKDTTNGGSGAHRLADPTTWEWSNNPALCLADYLFDDRLGLGAEGVTYDDIDWALVIAAANVCDATVSIPGSATEKRFTCNGALSTGNTYAENIKAILSSMNGQITWSGGKYRIRACAYEAPVYTFTGDDVVGDVQIQPERTRTQRFNTVRGTFVDPESDYVATEFIPYNDSNLQSGRDAGQKLTKDISLPMTNSEYMAQRIGYKMVALNDQQLRCIVPMNWKALKVGVGDRIQLSIDELSWSNKVFRVEGWTFNPDSGFNLTLQEDDATAYYDPGVSDYSTRTSAGTVVFADQPVPSPSNLSATAEEEAIFLQWANPVRASGYDEIIIYASATSAFSGATEIARTRGTSYRHELARNTQRYYWISAVDVDGRLSDEYAGTSTSSITATAGEIDFANLGGGTKPADNATNNGSTIDTDGNIAGSISTETTGDIHGGQTAYDTGTGYFLGYDTNAYKFSIGNSSGNKLTFDGSNLSVTGAITANSGSIASTVTIGGTQASTVVSGAADGATALQNGDDITDGTIGGVTITSTKLYQGTGTFNNSNTGFYLDSTGQFSLKDKLAFFPSNNTLRVKGNIEADVITVNQNLQVVGDLKASSLAIASITREMFTQDALDEIYGALATAVGGTNGDYKEASGSFTTSGGTVTLALFDHGQNDVVVEWLENHGFSQAADYTGTALQATLIFEASTTSNFATIAASKTETITLNKYDLSVYYGSTYFWYYGPRSVTKTFTTSDLADTTDYYFRVRVTNVGAAFTGITYPFKFEANEGVTGVVSTGGNADTLDNIDSARFLRSDEDDTFDGNLIVTGNLTVNGTTVTLNTATLDVEDKNITLASGAANATAAQGAGITIDGANRTFTYTAGDKFETNTGLWAYGNDQSASNYALVGRDSAGNNLLLVRNDGIVQVPSGYFFASNSAGAYFTGAIRARGGIQNDQGDLLLNDNVNVNGTLTIDHSTFGEGLVLERQDGTNSSSIKFTNTAGTAGILYGRHSDNELVWRDGTTTNNWMVWNEGNQGSGSGLDADTVDGLQASSLLRSDALDIFSGSYLEFQDNCVLRFGNSADFRIYHDGSSQDTYFRNYRENSNVYFMSEDSGGTNHAMIYLRGDTTAPYVQLYYDGNEVLRTSSGGVTITNNITSGGINTDSTKVVLGGSSFSNMSNAVSVAIGSAWMGSNASLFVNGFSRYNGPLYISDGGATNYVGIGYDNGKITATGGNGSGVLDAFDAPDGYYVGNVNVINGSRRAFFDRVYVGSGANDGFFYSDLDGRTAFASGDFYIQDSVTNFYNYATNQYYGGTSGDNIYFRGNALSGDNWTIATNGHFTSEHKLSVVSSGTHNDLLLLHATSDRYADAVMTDNGGSVRLRQDLGEFQVFAGGAANNAGASGAAKRFEVTSNGINVNGGAIYLSDTSIITSSRAAQNLASVSLDAGDGNAFGFWDSSTNYAIWMSSAGNSTYGGRVGGEPTSDYNMYFKMQSGTNRGFVFKDGANAFFAINPDTGIRSEVEAVWQDYIRMDKAGTATASTTSYPSQEIVFRSSGWDTNNTVARNCDWHVRAEASPSAYPDQSLVFYEQVPSYGHKKFELHGRNSGASYQDPDAATFYGTVNIQPTTDSTGGQLKLGSGNITLDNSADRSGLLDIQNAGQSWTGVQFTRASGDHWSVMGSNAELGLYDDLNAEWILLYTQDQGTNLYYNGAARLATTSGGVYLHAGLEIAGTAANVLNFSGAASSDVRGIAFNGRTALSSDNSDGYLRLNQNNEFTNGVYTPSPVWINNDLRIAEYIRHNGDDNTYLRFIAADDMQLVAGGRQMIRMDEGTNPDRLYFPNGSSYTDSSGNAVFAGNVTAYASDRRLKTRIKPIENALAKVMAIRGVTYDWIEGVEDLGFVPGRKNDCMGVIAQELEEAGVDQVIMPAPFDRMRSKETNWEDVSRSGEEYKTVDYDKLTALLIEAVKEQQTQIEALQAEIKEMKDGNH
jgi:hypothetical protein